MPKAKKYKYKINYFLGKREAAIPMGMVTALLESKYEINQRQFYRDKEITLDQDKSIAGDRLVKYAKFLGVTVEELLNYDVEGPTLDHIPKDISDLSDIGNKHGLVKPQ
ncbi:MAG: hypothetical protein ACK40G_13750 [Cytophagaceae bacterium]